ncbi:hypothetical protein [Slackia isoflavoniconvertens]|uniref:hypothetical protein n=1 Tax=Slackia isoflavoniconvertens TaxID=572010 RepID=UPI001616814F|nr:hypothetical protein [Slackia isoflavoniconvertens]MBB3279008.1 hypothetical protein [Slackia isoflavoniconvertens]
MGDFIAHSTSPFAASGIIAAGGAPTGSNCETTACATRARRAARALDQLAFACVVRQKSHAAILTDNIACRIGSIASAPLLANGLLAETVQFLIGAPQREALFYAENDNRIASIFAVEGTLPRRLQQAIRLAQIEIHGERERKRLISSASTLTLENLPTERFVKASFANHFRTNQTVIGEQPL